MKKLMTAIAAATAAFGLYAADPVLALHGASMEEDDNYVVDEGVFGEEVWDGFWATDGDADAAIVKAFGDGEEVPANLNYSSFDGADQLNYLKLETESPLYRAAASKEPQTGKGVDFLVPVAIEEDEYGDPRDGIMIDQLVKFTAFEAETEAVSLEEGAKIAVWVKGNADDETVGTLQITTAQIDENGEPQVTTVNTEIEVILTAWHQLKITSVVAAEVDGAVIPGFVVELDGNPIAMANGLWGEVLTDYYTEIGQQLIAENKLFPSMVVYGEENAGTLVGIAYKGTGAIDDVAVANYVAEEPEENEAEVNGEKYATIAAAIEAAEEGAEVTILRNVELADTLVINKAITLNLSGLKIKLAADQKVGIDITAAAEISNGSITSTLEANVAGSKAINIPNKDVTLTDVDIDASFYEYAIYANCDDDCVAAGDDLAWFYTDTDGKFATLSCDGVTIVGNGSLFHIEGMKATLNDCEATYKENDLFANEAHRAAVYSSLNAKTTITGMGTYEHENALQSGNLGGKIIVDADSTAEFSGNIKSYMKVGAHTELEQYKDYVAQFMFNGGTYNGTITFVDDAARTLDLFVKGEDVSLEPPKGYQWNEETGVLELIPEPTEFTVYSTQGEGTDLFVTLSDGTLVEDGESVPAGTELTIAVEQLDGYKDAKITVNGEEFTSGGTYTVDSEVSIESSATQLETWVVTVGEYDENQVESLTATPEEVREDAEDKTVTLTAVFKTGFVLDYYTVDGEQIDGDTFQITGNTIVGVVAKSVTPPGPIYPEEWPETDAATKAKFLEWVAEKGAGANLSTDAAKEAFLLNCTIDELDEEKAAFKITAFTGTAESIVTPEKNLGGDDFNGKVVTKAFDDVACTSEVTEPTGDETELFWKAFIVFPAAE